jgi:hypothetical protein
MLLFILFVNFIKTVNSDIIQEDFGPPENYVSSENIFASSLWLLGMYSCIELVSKYKEKNPIKTEPVEWALYGNHSDKKKYLELSVKEGHSLEKIKVDLLEMQTVIRLLEREEKEKAREKLIKEKGIETNIPSEVEYNFGKGEIRVKEHGKYYHGIMVTESEKYSNLKHDSNHRFFERTDDTNVEKWPITTSKHDEYCCNCSLDDYNSKNRRVYNIYVCNGHEYNEF